ncbi:MAG: class I SAM-dependent methyltransferase [Xanthobacteraceae bacterium]
MTQNVSELERWESRFAASDYVFGTAPNTFLKSQAHRLSPGQKALALADGEGRNGVWLAEQGLDVLSLDFSPNALKKARALAAARGVSLRAELADLSQWRWPVAEFDVIVAIFIQFADPQFRRQIFAGMKKALKPGGLLLMQGYRPEQLNYRTGGPPQAENLYTRDLLETAFGDFASVEINEHDSMVDEGAGHAGLSALIDFIGRK